MLRALDRAGVTEFQILPPTGLGHPILTFYNGLTRVHISLPGTPNGRRQHLRAACHPPVYAEGEGGNRRKERALINPRTLQPAGDVFPPRDEWDIAAYDADEVVAGFRESTPDDPLPSPNRSPAYRWGSINRARDRQVPDDGFDAIRQAFIRMRKNAH